MMALRLKLSFAGALPTALASACIMLAAVEPGSDSLRLWRIAIAWAAIGVLACLTIWALDRSAKAAARAVAAERVVADLIDEATMASKEAAKARKTRHRLADMDRRLVAVENDALGRHLAKKLWTNADAWDEFTLED